jgi:plasmid stabilization system protein ParE
VTIYFAPEAEADLAAVIGYLVDRNPVAASDLGDRIFEVIDKLAEQRFEGPEQTLRSGEVVRSWPVPPVRIYYQRRPGALWVLRIYHQAQTPIAR